ncbi:putative ribonuclease H-like domain-containing protein [Tanacetum coccineum]|uniref:Ribonuclease H-like domain-containing protein n=1 Tax=Tanacetum coccineum TaxID=301880 RepID=A0ABQ5DXH6_9ASTR
MSQPANDNFSLHDDEELSLHDDTSLDGSIDDEDLGSNKFKGSKKVTGIEAVEEETAGYEELNHALNAFTVNNEYPCALNYDRFIKFLFQANDEELGAVLTYQSMNDLSMNHIPISFYDRQGKFSTVSSADTQIKSGSSRFNTGKQNVNSGSSTEAKILNPKWDLLLLEEVKVVSVEKEFSNARTPQQNRVAERMNRTLIEAARTMLADSHLPTTFWAEAVNTACYHSTWVHRVIDIDEQTARRACRPMVVSSTSLTEQLRRKQWFSDTIVKKDPLP